MVVQAVAVLLGMAIATYPVIIAPVFVRDNADYAEQQREIHAWHARRGRSRVDLQPADMPCGRPSSGARALGPPVSVGVGVWGRLCVSVSLCCGVCVCLSLCGVVCVCLSVSLSLCVCVCVWGRLGGVSRCGAAFVCLSLSIFSLWWHLSLSFVMFFFVVCSLVREGVNHCPLYIDVGANKGTSKNATCLLFSFPWICWLGLLEWSYFL